MRGAALVVLLAASGLYACSAAPALGNGVVTLGTVAATGESPRDQDGQMARCRATGRSHKECCESHPDSPACQ